MRLDDRRFSNPDRFGAALAGNLLYVWAIIAASVTNRSLRQVLVPRELLGRVTASWRLGGQAVTLIGGVVAGAAAGLLGNDPRPVFAGLQKAPSAEVASQFGAGGRAAS